MSFIAIKGCLTNLLDMLFLSRKRRFIDLGQDKRFAAPDLCDSDSSQRKGWLMGTMSPIPSGWYHLDAIAAVIQRADIVDFIIQSAGHRYLLSDR